MEWVENRFVGRSTVACRSAFWWFESNRNKDHGDMTRNLRCVTIVRSRFVNKNTNNFHDYQANCLDRVRNPKNQVLQIEPPTIVGCSLWYPIARSTMKPEARLSSSQKYQF